MDVAQIRELKAGDRLILRKWDSLDEDIRNGVDLQLVRVVKRHYGPVLIALWDGEECELRLSDYRDCLQRLPA